ncbi:MAG: asparagine synthase (glutamine-hydrolyzing) [Thermoleophilaceae bacterium]|nr:asparagine synthase (glutamine-hydrolyzing) [Thermoleophilaceae bacterium]
MCGIAGIVGAPPERAALEAMAAAMERRGPDGEGFYEGTAAGLAFRRLAIIDLDERSNQPLALGPLRLVFNGEIYNYRELREELRGRGHTFTTEGDGEVLLHAWSEWGEDALGRLNGMFALAVWDEDEGSLVLASDPFGEKPLYYATVGERLLFGSRFSAFLPFTGRPAEADAEALEGFLTRAAMPALGGSFFRGVKRLAGGHLLRFAGGRAEVGRWWRPPEVEVPGEYPEAVAALRELLLDSLRLRLRSDVPVGTSLSGGVDSSTVVALSAELAGDHRRHAFTATFPGFERDEWRYAETVARAAGVVEHHAVRPDADALLGDLDALVRGHEEPFGFLSIYAQWCVMRAAEEAGVTVLLDGQGGDELFAGYDISRGYGARTLGPRAMSKEPRETLASAGVGLVRGPLRRTFRRRTAAPYLASETVERAARAERSPEPPPYAGAADPLRRQLAEQQTATILPELLRYADRSSMAWSREVRLPLLDPRIAGFAWAAPASFLYSGGVTKRILRDAGRGAVPDSVLDRTDKVGFEPPQARWLAEPAMRERIAEVLLDPAARARGLYDGAAIESDLAAGEWRDHRAIWRCLNAELWLRAMT